MFFSAGTKPSILLRDEDFKRHLERPAARGQFARVEIGLDGVRGLAVVEVHEVVAHRDGGA